MINVEFITGRTRNIWKITKAAYIITGQSTYHNSKLCI